jgi:thioredoxin-like negative regulator of GroEL
MEQNGQQGASRDWEQRVAGLWTAFDDLGEDEFRASMDELVAELPAASPVGMFEQACALDATDQPEPAVALYRQALDAGLSEGRRRQAVIQLASSLRNLGQAPQSVAVLRAEQEAASDQLDDAVIAFLALALVDTGQEREAVSLLLGALIPHLPMYQRSLTNYAQLIVDPAGQLKPR